MSNPEFNYWPQFGSFRDNLLKLHGQDITLTDNNSVRGIVRPVYENVNSPKPESRFQGLRLFIKQEDEFPPQLVTINSKKFRTGTWVAPDASGFITTDLVVSTS